MGDTDNRALEAFEAFMKTEAPSDYDASNGDAWYVWKACWAAALASRPAEVDDWINVEDRLPPMDESVLVFLPNNGDSLVEMDSWGEIYECPVSFSSESVCVGEGWSNNDFDDVSHWRKMPAAPSHTTNKEK